MTPQALKCARRSLGLSVRDLAALVGATPRTVRRWERGSLPLAPGVAQIVAAALQASGASTQA